MALLSKIVNSFKKENLETENFDSKMADAELVRQIELWEKEGTDFFGKLQEIIKTNLEYYYGNQTGSDRIYGNLSKTVENRIWMAVETAIPIVTGKLPEVIVKPDNDDEKSQQEALSLQNVLNATFDRVKINSKAERFTRDMMVKRFGVFKVFWNNEINDTDVKIVDPRRIMVSRWGKTINDCKWLIEELEMEYDSVSDYFGESVAKDLLKSKGSEESGDNKVRKPTFKIQEVWTNDYVCWRSGNLILKKIANPYYNFETPEENYFMSPQKPYIIKSLFETEESIIGDTDYVQQLIPIQDNINRRKRQIEDLSNKIANPHLLIDSEAMSEEGASNITNEPGQILYGKGVASENRVRFENPGVVPAYLFNDLTSSRQEFDNLFGLHSTTRGERGTSETATGRQILREADFGRLDGVARQIERALDDTAEYFTQLMKMFYDVPRDIPSMGENGVEMERGFSSQSIRRMKPQVKQGSTIQDDENSMAQKALLLWNARAIGIRTLLKMLKIPDIETAVNDYADTQSGAIVQQKVAQMQQTQMQNGIQGQGQIGNGGEIQTPSQNVAGQGS